MSPVSRFTCPSCRSTSTYVARTTTSKADGFIIRHRRCHDCAYSWYSGQDPEYLLPMHKIGWNRNNPFLKQ